MPRTAYLFVTNIDCRLINNESFDDGFGNTFACADESRTVQRGEIPLCEAVTLHLSTGSIYHLVGANGTGKTTLLMQLAGLRQCWRVRLFIKERQVCPVSLYMCRAPVGYSSQSHCRHKSDVFAEFIWYHPSATDIDKALAWWDCKGLKPSAQTIYLLGKPAVSLGAIVFIDARCDTALVIDEPFTALDVDMVAQNGRPITILANAGGAILMTSHQAVGGPIKCSI